MQITPLNNLTIHIQKLVQGKLWLKVIIGIILGAILGAMLNPSAEIVSAEFSEKIGYWLDMPGQVFLRMVQMIMIPLIFTSIVSGIVSNSSDNLKSMGLRLMIYFMFTTAVAIVIGIVLTLVMNPGEYVNSLGGLPGGEDMILPVQESAKSLPEMIVNLIPNNPLKAMLTGEMLGIVIFTVLVGIAITKLKPETAQPMIRFSSAVQKVCMIIIGWAMLLVPYAVFGMMESYSLDRTTARRFVRK